MITHDCSGNCEWCGERFVKGEELSMARKNGTTVFYHEECQVNDISELDAEYQDAYQVGLWL